MYKRKTLKSNLKVNLTLNKKGHGFQSKIIVLRKTNEFFLFTNEWKRNIGLKPCKTLSIDITSNMVTKMY